MTACVAHRGVRAAVARGGALAFAFVATRLAVVHGGKVTMQRELDREIVAALATLEWSFRADFVEPTRKCTVDKIHHIPSVLQDLALLAKAQQY